MPTKKDIESRFWKALKSDMTMMLGLVDVENSHLRPLTAQLGGRKSSIWFFTAMDTAIFRSLKKSGKGIATFVSKKHDIFATLHGRLSLDTDKATLDRLWTPSLPPGSTRARKIPNSPSSASIRPRPKSGWTIPASLPA